MNQSVCCCSSKNMQLLPVCGHVMMPEPNQGTANLSPLVGAVVPFPTREAPDGWLKCNGAEVNRETYPALYAVIGDSFGAGDGSTTFNLPDLRGEFLRGWDDSRGADAGRTLGSWQKGSIASGGDQTKSQPALAGVYNSQDDDKKAFRQRLGYDEIAGTYEGMSIVFYNGTLGNNPSLPHESYGITRPRNIALLFCIKY